MKWFSLLLAASSLPAKEILPVLLDPRVVQVSAGTTLWPGVDSVDVGSRGLFERYIHTDSGIRLDTSWASGSINQDFPRFDGKGIFDGPNGPYDILLNRENPSGAKTTIDLAPIAQETVKLGEGIPFRDSFRSGVLVCGEGEAAYLERGRRVFSTTSGGPGQILCHTSIAWKKGADSQYVSRQWAAMAWRPNPAVRAWAIRSDSANQPGLGRKPDTLKVGALAWILSDTTGRWLTFDQESSTLYWRTGNPEGGFRYDSLKIDGLPANAKPCRQVSQYQDFIVFGVGEEILFLRWGGSSVQVVSRVAIPGKSLVAAAVYRYNKWDAKTHADRLPRVWALTGTELYSFQMTLLEREVSHLVRSPGAGAIRVTAIPGGATLLGGASGVARGRIHALDGRILATLELRPDRPVHWRAPAPGAYLLVEGEATRAFVVH